MRLAIALAALGSASALSGCAGLKDLFKEPTFRLERVVVHDVGLQGGALDLIVGVDNPNQFDLHGTGLEAGFDVEQTHLGTVRLTDDFAVTKAGVTTLTLPLSFQWAGVGTAVRFALEAGEIPYTMKGQARLETPFGQYDVPFEGQGRVPVTMPQGVRFTPSGH
jgi:LEA14-like dessication related protein